MVKTHSREASHLEQLSLRKENPLRRRRSRSRCLEGRIGAASQESLSAVGAQVFAGRIKIAQLRGMLYVPRIDPSALKLFAVEGRTLCGQPHGPPEACALHLLNRPLRR